MHTSQSNSPNGSEKSSTTRHEQITQVRKALLVSSRPRISLAHPRISPSHFASRPRISHLELGSCKASAWLWCSAHGMELIVFKGELNPKLASNQTVSKSNIVLILIKNSRNAWPTKMVLPFSSFSDNFHLDHIHIIFHTSVDNDKIAHKTCS